MRARTRTSLAFGRLLLRLRNEKGFTQREVAQITGVSGPYLSQLEQGQVQEPSLHKLYELAKCYKTSYAELIRAAGYVVPVCSSCEAS